MIGTAFSGTTLLGNALNALPGVSYVGEIARLPAFNAGVAESTCWLCLSAGTPCPVWSPEGIAEVQSADAPGTHAALRRLTGSDVIVDGSKEVRWLWQSATHVPGPKILHTVRSPFAVIDTIQRVEGYTIDVASGIWRDTVADTLRAINSASLPSMVIRYEELAMDPVRMLPAVCLFIGADYDPSALRFWEHPVHAIGGNPGAYAWYPGFADWHAKLEASLLDGTVDRMQISDSLREFLRTNGPPRPEFAKESDFAGTVRSYAERKFGGFVDRKWRKRLTAGEISHIMRTPGLADLASLVGYDLLRMLDDEAPDGEPLVS
jgi:hypothetical protein